MQDFQGQELLIGDKVIVAGRSHSKTYLKKATVTAIYAFITGFPGIDVRFEDGTVNRKVLDPALHVVKL